MREPYIVTVSGCDASTEVMAVLTDAESETVHRLAELVNAKSEYGCQPTMSVRPATAQEIAEGAA